MEVFETDVVYTKEGSQTYNSPVISRNGYHHALPFAHRHASYNLTRFNCQRRREWNNILMTRFTIQHEEDGVVSECLL